MSVGTTADPGPESGLAQHHAAEVVSGVVTPELLRVVWREHVRPALRAARLRDLYLAQDPIQFAAYEWGLGSFIARLHGDVAAGTYSPDPAQVVRAAKNQGLTRPLAFLSPRDALLYRTIILLAERELGHGLDGWVGATRVDRAIQSDAATGADQYGDWFSVWLRKQGVISSITAQCAFVVESDIASYFQSIDLRVVREHLLNRSGLHRDVVRLCVFLLEHVVRHPGYADAPSLGLPQESLSSSRAIGHSLLGEVDKVFQAEGEQQKYSRFMDDFAIGAESIEDGHRKVARLQHALEPLGLHPNSSKTRVVERDAFLHDVMAEENGYLDSVDSVLDQAEEGELHAVGGLDSDWVREVEARAAAHHAIRREERPQRWDRVLRRYYTVLRRMRSQGLLEEAIGDLQNMPGSAAPILEYVRSFPLEGRYTQRLLTVGISMRGIDEDVPLLIVESLANCPNSGDAKARSPVVVEALELCRGSCRGDTLAAATDRLVAACIPLIGKFGSAEHHESFRHEIWPCLPEKSQARLQALPFMMSAGWVTADRFNSAVPGLPWSTVLNLEFLRALESGDDKATGVALGLLQPQPRLQPTRFHIHSRPLLLVGVLNISTGRRLSLVAASAVARAYAKESIGASRRAHRAATWSFR